MPLDFIKIKKKDKGATIYPDFVISNKVKDIMFRGGSFYAIWDEEKKLWSTNEYDVQRLVDKELYLYNQTRDNEYHVATLEDFSSKEWLNYKNWVKKMPDNYHELDRNIIFANSECEQKDYASIRLPYNISDSATPFYDKLIDVIYDPEERAKIEWAIGSIIAGDSKTIQKFIVFYGESGSGKSTVMNIIQQLFDGYYSVFEAKALANSNNSFALEEFKNNPIVAIQHDGDLSRIEDNTKLNSIISHEKMSVNEKFKSKYEMAFHSFLFMGTNSPVKITDARSGMNRRLIDVHPSNRKLPYSVYMECVDGIKFELGGIANKCLKRYEEMGIGYYNNYIPIDMISGTNHFYDYVCENYEFFRSDKFISLKSAWSAYKEYVDYARVSYTLSLQRFKEELKAYFEAYIVNRNIDGKHVRNSYMNFREEKVSGSFSTEEIDISSEKETWLKFEPANNSVFDICAADYPAQYASEKGTPLKKWKSVTDTLKDIATSQLHYVKVPDNHIVIDFDLKDNEGNKSLEKNIAEASKFPETYAEVSKSGNGIHLHYIYDGDVSKLSRIYSEGIEVKIFNGDSSLRRMLKTCVNKQIAHLSSGLPTKEESTKVVNFDNMSSEKALRTMILRNLKKEYHGATKPSVDFIHFLLEKAYNTGMVYDVTDLRPAIQSFAIGSTNHAQYCLKLVGKMKFKSETESAQNVSTGELCFFDVEVFKNVFIVCYKIAGEGKSVVKMINPSVRDIEDLMKKNLVGFNCRNYDNHILYARGMGYGAMDLYQLSKRIIEGSPNSKFREAYNISHTDVYDFASKKQSLKKWEIELEITHHENAYPWDEPLDESHWAEVAEYCADDVRATEAVFNHLKGDYAAREILATLTGKTVNDTTNSLTTALIFGNERSPKLNWTDLSKEFPEYSFRDGKNWYKDEEVGFGGCIRSWPGMYTNVALLDIQSMHPTTAIVIKYFGEYTPKFKALKDARVFIKHGDLENAKECLHVLIDDKSELAAKIDDILSDPSLCKALAQALKIAINSVYGLTSAKFDNPFRDPRNVNNIVALRGALFMLTLRDKVLEKGYKIVAIKTDSIKIADADEGIIDFCTKFAGSYGYVFEHEETYAKICQINDADYIAKTREGEWTATGKAFQIPYVFKTLFSKDPIEFKDLCETKEVKSALYLDMNEKLGEDEHDYRFIGRIGRFCPIKEGRGGGVLLRDKGDGTFAAATGSKGYRWLESENVKALNVMDDIDMSYFRKLVDDAVDNISQYGDFGWFVD